MSPEEILEVAAILEAVANAIWELAGTTAEAVGEPVPEYLVRQYTDWELPVAPAPLKLVRRAPTQPNQEPKLGKEPKPSKKKQTRSKSSRKP